MGEHDGREDLAQCQIYRRYKTDQGEYREANTYALADLVQVARVAELAEEWLNRRAESRQQLHRQRRGGAMKKDDVLIFSYTRAQAIADGVLLTCPSSPRRRVSASRSR